MNIYVVQKGLIVAICTRTFRVLHSLRIFLINLVRGMFYQRGTLYQSRFACNC